MSNGWDIFHSLPIQFTVSGGKMIVNFLEIIVDLFLSRSFMINLETKIHLITKETISSCTTLA